MVAEEKERIILFVVGMHRSGTSALTRAFGACGATTGDDVLSPMEGVNSEGFWEDKSVVALNEDLLHQAKLEWYFINSDCDVGHIAVETRQRAKAIVARGFGGGLVELVKDPRLCITLPVWLRACKELGVSARVCVIHRNTIEVANSLQKRDGFPLSYGFWLADNYQQFIDRIPLDGVLAASTNYDQLLRSPDRELGRLLDELALPLRVDSGALGDAVQERLKHQHSDSERPGAEGVDVAGNVSLLGEMAVAFVDRGMRLTDLGEQHSHALAIIKERDGQLHELQRQMQLLGEHHTHAVSVVEERDAQLVVLNREIAKLLRELDLHKSWKKKMLLSLGLITHEK